MAIILLCRKRYKLCCVNCRNMKRRPLPGIPIKYKIIKGHKYMYQVIRAWRDKNTGQVIKIERYLGAAEPARPTPTMDLLSTKERQMIIDAWQSGEDIEAIMLRVQVYTGGNIGQASTYKWFKDNNIPRNRRTEKRQPGRAEEKLRRAAQAAIRA